MISIPKGSQNGSSNATEITQEDQLEQESTEILEVTTENVWGLKTKEVSSAKKVKVVKKLTSFEILTPEPTVLETDYPVLRQLSLGKIPNHTFDIDDGHFDFYKGLYVRNIVKIKKEGYFGELSLLSSLPEH